MTRTHHSGTFAIGACIQLALIAALSACFQNQPENPSAEAVELMQTSREWSKAAATGDMNAVLSYFADDAILIQEGQSPVRGKKALRAYLLQTSKIPGFRISWEPLEAQVSGKMGYIIERTQVTFKGPQGLPVRQQLQAVTVWRKQADDKWRNVIDVTVSAAPARS
jgi:uncharacterized protein (TIGR02246 family)